MKNKNFLSINNEFGSYQIRMEAIDILKYCHLREEMSVLVKGADTMKFKVSRDDYEKTAQSMSSKENN